VETEAPGGLHPDEKTRLLESIRRARQDLAEGRVYRTSEQGLVEFLRIAGALRDGTPIAAQQASRPSLDEPEAARLAIQLGIEQGWIEPA
jgi:hypothetical protein